jgi:hypothetical protein
MGSIAVTPPSDHFRSRPEVPDGGPQGMGSRVGQVHGAMFPRHPYCEGILGRVGSMLPLPWKALRPILPEGSNSPADFSPGHFLLDGSGRTVS